MAGFALHGTSAEMLRRRRDAGTSLGSTGSLREYMGHLRDERLNHSVHCGSSTGRTAESYGIKIDRHTPLDPRSVPIKSAYPSLGRSACGRAKVPSGGWNSGEFELLLHMLGVNNDLPWCQEDVSHSLSSLPGPWSRGKPRSGLRVTCTSIFNVHDRITHATSL